MMQRFVVLIGMIMMLAGCNATSDPKKSFEKRWDIEWSITEPDEFSGSAQLFDIKIDCDKMFTDIMNEKQCTIDVNLTMDQYTGHWIDEDPGVIDVISVWEDKVFFDDALVKLDDTGHTMALFGTASAKASMRVGECHFDWNSVYLNNLKTGKKFTLESSSDSPSKCKVVFVPYE